MSILRIFLTNAFLTITFQAAFAESIPRYQKTFDEISGLVQTFYIHDKGTLQQWEGVVQKFKTILPKVEEPRIFALNLNLALDHLGLGRDALIHDSEQEYWLHAEANPKAKQNQNAFYFGAWFERRGRNWYVLDIFPGGPAQKAGLMRGDEIITLEGQDFNPILLTQHQASRRSYQLTWRRDPLEKPRKTEIQVVAVNYQEAFARLIHSSARVELIENKRLAYVRLPAMRSEWLIPFQQNLTKTLAGADALLLDLRYGLAGRDSGFLPLFFENIAPEGARPTTLIGKRPIFIIVDKKTQEGLEWLAHLLQQQYSAILIGEATAGQPFQSEEVNLKSGPFILRLGRPDPSSEDGLRYGQSLKVDQEIKAPLIYARGKDEILEQSLKFAVESLKKGS